MKKNRKNKIREKKSTSTISSHKKDLLLKFPNRGFSKQRVFSTAKIGMLMLKRE
jgi:hypothetical protein